jgi:hypothetical protein
LVVRGPTSLDGAFESSFDHNSAESEFCFGSIAAIGQASQGNEHVPDAARRSADDDNFPPFDMPNGAAAGVRCVDLATCVPPSISWRNFEAVVLFSIVVLTSLAAPFSRGTLL